MSTSKLSAMLATMLDLYREGVPYLWGAKGPEMVAQDERGAWVRRPVPEGAALFVDCSGAATFSAWKAGGPDWRFSHTSAMLASQLPRTSSPAPGDLAFYGPVVNGKARIEHVMMILTATGGGDFLVIGACGGNSRTLTLEDARRRDARVKVYQSVNYRADFRWFTTGIPL